MSTTTTSIQISDINQTQYPQMFTMLESPTITKMVGVDDDYKELKAWVNDLTCFSPNVEVNVISDKVHILVGEGASDYILVTDPNMTIAEVQQMVNIEIDKQVAFGLKHVEMGEDLNDIECDKYGYYLMAAAHNIIAKSTSVPKTENCHE